MISTVDHTPKTLNYKLYTVVYGQIDTNDQILLFLTYSVLAETFLLTDSELDLERLRASLFGSPVLEPSLHLSFAQRQLLGDLPALRRQQIGFHAEHRFQFVGLLMIEADLTAFARFRLHCHLHPNVELLHV